MVLCCDSSDFGEDRSEYSPWDLLIGETISHANQLAVTDMHKLGAVYRVTCDVFVAGTRSKGENLTMSSAIDYMSSSLIRVMPRNSTLMEAYTRGIASVFKACALTDCLPQHLPNAGKSGRFGVNGFSQLCLSHTTLFSTHTYHSLIAYTHFSSIRTSINHNQPPSPNCCLIAGTL